MLYLQRGRQWTVRSQRACLDSTVGTETAPRRTLCMGERCLRTEKEEKHVNGKNQLIHIFAKVLCQNAFKGIITKENL